MQVFSVSSQKDSERGEEEEKKQKRGETTWSLQSKSKTMSVGEWSALMAGV